MGRGLAHHAPRKEPAIAHVHVGGPEFAGPLDLVLGLPTRVEVAARAAWAVTLAGGLGVVGGLGGDAREDPIGGRRPEGRACLLLGGLGWVERAWRYDAKGPHRPMLPSLSLHCFLANEVFFVFLGDG